MSDPEFSAEDCKAVNDACTRLGENYQQALQLGIKEPELYFNCLFLSVDALMVLLDNVDSNESFWRELRVTKHLTFGSLNWYEDYRLARRTDPKVAEAIAATGKMGMLSAP